jgi:rhodanese-related sulfurtransferase
MGQLTLKIPKKGKTADLIDVRVPKEYRRKGISKNLFARATQFLEKAGFKFLRSDDLQHPAQAKIRSAYGRYKAGSKTKNRTKFTADQFGRWGEESKLVKKDSVIAILKDNATGRQIKATTMLKKRKK